MDMILKKRFGKVKDSEVRELIRLYDGGGLDSAAVKRIIGVSDDDYGDAHEKTRMGRFFDSHEKALKKLFCEYYDEFYNSVDTYGAYGALSDAGAAATLSQMLFIVSSEFDETDPDCVLLLSERVSIKYGVWFYVSAGDVYYRDYDLVKSRYDDAVARGKLDLSRIIAFCDAHTEKSGFFIDILARHGDKRAVEFFCRLVAQAGLQDTIRTHVFYSAFSKGSRAVVSGMLDAVNTNKWYKLPAFSQSFPYGAMFSELSAEKRLKIAEDALCGDTGKYLTGDAQSFITLAAALWTFDRPAHEKLIRAALGGSDAAVKHAAMYAATRKTGHGEIFMKDMIAVAVDICDWHMLTIDYKPEKNTKYNRAVADGLIGVIDAMPRSSVKADAGKGLEFISDLSRWEIVRLLWEIYRFGKDSHIVEELDRRYDGLDNEAKTQYLRLFKDATKLDVHAKSLEFYKFESYAVDDYLRRAKLEFTFADAVATCDFLKSKRQSVKMRLIKEYTKSRDAIKIAEYLWAQPEEHKRDAAAEMQKSGVKIKSADSRKSETGRADVQTYAYSPERGFEIPFPKQLTAALKSPAKLKNIKPLSVAHVREMHRKVTEFFAVHADHEYSAMFCDGLVTLGSTFSILKDAPSRDSYAAYPFGEEIAEILESCLSEEEIALYYVAMMCGDRGEQTYKKTFGDKIFELWRAEWKGGVAESAIAQLMHIAVKKIEPDIRLDAELQLIKNGYLRDNVMFSVLDGVISSGKPLDWDKVVYFIALCLHEGVKGSYSVPQKLFADGYDSGKFSDELAEYMLLKRVISFGRFTDPKNEFFYLASGEKYGRTKAFLRAFSDKAVDAETSRGSMPTVYTSSLYRTTLHGVDTYFKVLNALRRFKLTRDLYGDEADSVLSGMLRQMERREDDSYDKFSALAKSYGFNKAELVRAAVFNPEYIDYTEKYLNIQGLKLTVYWFTAHLNEEISDARRERIREFSEIDIADFKDGAFDRAWYDEMVKTIPSGDFMLVYDNAKYITVAGLHKRAQRFFDALDGRVTTEECIEHIDKSRNKDWVLVYSLVPLKDERDLMSRYETLTEFLRTGKSFGAQRQASERRTVDIALENLARSAGYDDVNIFIYETEAKNVSELFGVHDICGARIVPVIDNYRVSLATEDGGKLAAKTAKDKAVSALKELCRAETARLKRTKLNLERAMCENVVFTVAQLKAISAHPVIDSLLRRLVFLANGRAAVLKDGALVSLTGSAVKADSAVIAHPVRLKAAGELGDAIAYIVKNNIVQPFKQVLREIYELTPEEREQDSLLRFKGFNVNIKKCVAALKGRGWGVSPDIGTRKVFYKSDTIAAVFREFDLFYTYDWGEEDRELYCVDFFGRRSGEQMHLKDVDPVVFSETCRDVDLVVSISCNNVYDFNNAMSAVEVRRNIIMALCDILKLKNVGFLKDNIRVEGAFGTYTVNIRTGLVFKDGVGNLAISTVHTSKKPILLDFIDEDPVTADIISKALVLSDDANIKDGALLSQLKA